MQFFFTITLFFLIMIETLTQLWTLLILGDSCHGRGKMNIQNHVSAFILWRGPLGTAARWRHPACHLCSPALYHRLKQAQCLEWLSQGKMGKIEHFSVSRLQHIFMSALISAREVFLLNELVVIPVRLKLPLTLCYPIRVFQKALTPIITLQGFVHYRPSSEVQGKVFTNCYTLCQLTPQKLIFPHSILW